MKNNPAWLPWFILIVLAIIWGASFKLMLLGMRSFTWDQVAALRLAAAGMVLWPFAIAKLRKPTRTEWFWLFLIGLLGNGIPAFLFTGAETQISSAMAGILNSLTPLFTLLTGVVLFHIRFPLMKFLGVMIGLCGAVMLVIFAESEPSKDPAANMEYGLLVVLATLFYGLSANMIREKTGVLSAVEISAFALGMMAVPAWTYLLSTDFTDRLQVQPEAWSSVGYILILAWIGSAFAVILFNRLIRMTGAVFGASVTYFIPIVAVFLGFLSGESITWIHFVGMGSIIGGVVIVNRKR